MPKIKYFLANQNYKENSKIMEQMFYIGLLLFMSTINLRDIMPKTSKKQIDVDEKKVIAELQKNSKESIDKIAKKCKFSRQKVWRIIKRLEKSKTIWGYFAVVDNEKLKVKRFVMLIKRTNKPMTDAIEKIIDLTMHKKGQDLGINILCSGYLHGCYDWLFIFTAPDIKNVKKFSEVLSREYNELIGNIDILEDIFTVKKCGMVNPNLDKLREFA